MTWWSEWEQFYLNVVGEPVEVGVCVLHSEEHVSSGYDPPLGDGFDPDGEPAVVFLTKSPERWLHISFI